MLGRLITAAARAVGATALVFLVTWGSASRVHAAPAPGTGIDNQASATFRSALSTADETLTSNTVTAQVSGVARLVLQAGNTRNVAAGARIFMQHTLRNEGNLSDSVLLRLFDSGADSGELINSQLWLDADGNGLVDGDDRRIDPALAVSLLPSEVLSLLIETTVPATSQDGDIFLLELQAAGQSGTVQALNRLQVNLNNEVLLTWGLGEMDVTAKKPFALDLELAVDGPGVLQGRPITVDGQSRAMVTLSMPLAAGVFLHELPQAPAGYQALYPITGGGKDVFSTLPPADLATLGRIVFAKEQIDTSARSVFNLPLIAVGDSRDVSVQATLAHSGNSHVSVPAVVRVQASVEDESNVEDNDTTGLWVNRAKTTVENPMIAHAGELTDLTFICYSCDMDAERLDSVVIEILSDKTGDVERITLTESDPHSSRFVFDKLLLVSLSDAPSVSGDGRMSVTKNNWLHFTVTLPDGRILKQSLLVDPAGYVFDSLSGVPLVNVEVTLYRLGTDGSVSLADVFANASGTVRVANPTVTNDEGYYEFPFAAPGSYRLEITRLPPGFTAPSQRSGADMADFIALYTHLSGLDDSGALVSGANITQAQGPSYGGIFRLQNQAVFIDMPVDPDYLNADASEGRGLALSLSADRASVSIGEAVNYTLQLENRSGNRLSDAQIAVDLPLGFQFLADSARLDGAALANPRVQNGQMVFELGAMDHEQALSLSFRAIVTPGATGGNGVTLARALASGIELPGRSAATYHSRHQRLKINLDAGVFREDGVIIGKVFRDCDGDGLQSDDTSKEPGVQGVRIYLQNGRYAETDDFGRYSFARLRPSRYLVKADTNSSDLPWKLSRYRQQNGDHDSLIRADLTAGELFRADFPLAACGELAADKPAAVVETESETKSEALQTATALPPGQKNVDKALEDPGKNARVRIMAPSDKARIAEAQTTIAIDGATTVSYELYVNDTALDDTRLGSQVLDKANERQRLQYFAVPLQHGKNTVTAVARDPWGNERGRHSIEIWRPAALAGLRWQTPTETLAADGSQHTISLELVDASGVRVAGDQLVQISVVDGASAGAAIVDTDLDAQQAGSQLMASDGLLTFTLLSPTRTGSVILQARAGAFSEDITLRYRPKLREWIVAGMVEGDVDHYTEGKGTLGEESQHHDFKGRIEGLDHTSDNGDSRYALRGSIFAKGTVKDDYLVTLIADTDKRDEDDWAGLLDLRRDYPIYGDGATSGAEGEAEEGLYLKVEHEESFLLIGDFRPDQDQRRTRAGAYNRKFYGMQHHYEGGRWRVDSFAAQPSTNQVVDFIRARGTSGPFLLSQQNLVANSEQVEVITRTRAPDGEIVAIEALTAFVDYELDPVLASLVLRAPLAGSDEQGRPRYLRITYNVEGDHQPSFDALGTDISFLVNDNLTLGARALTEREDHQDYTLSSVNGLFQLNASTRLVSEIAQSERSGLSHNDSGIAVNVRLEHQSKKRDVQVQLADTEQTFVNASAATTAGTQSADLRWLEHLNNTSDVVLSLRDFGNYQTNTESQTAEIGLQKRVSDSIKLGIAVEEATTEDATGTQYSDTSLGVNGQYRPDFLSALTLEGRAYQSLETQRQRHSLSADYQLPRAGSFTLGWERLDGYDVNSDLGEEGGQLERWSAGYKQQVHSTTELYSEYRLQNAAGGRENSAATGLRYGYDIKEGLRLVAQTERTQDLADNPEDPARYSWALGLSGFDDDTSTWLARIEMLAAQDRRWLQEFRWARRINDDWSLLTKERLQWRDRFADHATSASLGLAYRPKDRTSWDWLGSFGLDKNLADAQNITPQITRTTMRNTLNLRPVERWTITTSAVAQHISDSSEHDYTSLAYLGRLRLRYDLSSKWSVGALGSYFADKRFDGGNNSWGAEIQRSFGGKFFVGLRYQHFAYRNGGIDPDSVYRRGISLNFGGTFDEGSLSSLLKMLE